MEGEWSCYRGGKFNGESLFNGPSPSIKQAASVTKPFSLHVRGVASLMEGEYSCYGGGQFKVGRMVMLERWSL